MSSRLDHAGPALAVVGVAAGLLLLGLPWAPAAAEAPLPGRFTAADPAFARIGELLARLDAAIGTADVAAFRAATTDAFVRGIERRLRVLDRRLNRAALLDWAAQRPEGEFTRLLRGELRAAVAAAGRAGVVFAAADGRASPGTLVGLALDAGAGGLRLDAVRVLPPDTASSAEQLAADLLRGVP
jgi:hypothetical protein